MMKRISVYAPGNFDYADSYGLIACQLARHLTALGVRVNVFAMGKTVMDNQPADVRAVTEQPIMLSLGGLLLGYPTGFARHANPLAQMGPRIAITMFESSKIPASWIEPLNQCGAVIVPSQFCAETFAACGVTVPIHVAPLGVGEVYQPGERTLDRPLTFLAFLDRGARKGGLAALQAFLAVFGDSMDYRLILKARKPKVRLELTNPNIEVVQQDMTEQELYELYLRCDVLINPNKGEGFGLLPREFAATGGVSLATAWGGTADDIEQWGWALPYTLEPADWSGNKTLQGQDLGVWAKPDMEGIAQRLNDVATFAGVYRYQAEHRAANVAKLYSWRAFAERVLAIYEEVAVGNNVTAAKIAA